MLKFCKIYEIHHPLVICLTVDFEHQTKESGRKFSVIIPSVFSQLLLKGRSSL